MSRSLVAVVDDDSVYAKYLCVFLSVRGYDSAAYSRGDALLEAIREGASPDVNLLDVNTAWQKGPRMPRSTNTTAS